MKNIILALIMISTASLFAQKVETKVEKQGDQMKVTKFFDNGSVQEVGFFKDGKPDGKWISYNVEGKKVSEGSYDKGKKVGNWFFWKKNQLSEVVFKDNRVASVQNWNQDGGIVYNKNK